MKNNLFKRPIQPVTPPQHNHVEAYLQKITQDAKSLIDENVRLKLSFRAVCQTNESIVNELQNQLELVSKDLHLARKQHKDRETSLIAEISLLQEDLDSRDRELAQENDLFYGSMPTTTSTTAATQYRQQRRRRPPAPTAAAAAAAAVNVDKGGGSSPLLHSPARRPRGDELKWLAEANLEIDQLRVQLRRALEDKQTLAQQLDQTTSRLADQQTEFRKCKDRADQAEEERDKVLGLLSSFEEELGRVQVSLQQSEEQSAVKLQQQQTEMDKLKADLDQAVALLHEQHETTSQAQQQFVDAQQFFQEELAKMDLERGAWTEQQRKQHDAVDQKIRYYQQAMAELQQSIDQGQAVVNRNQEEMDSLLQLVASYEQLAWSNEQK